MVSFFITSLFIYVKYGLINGFYCKHLIIFRLMISHFLSLLIVLLTLTFLANSFQQTYIEPIYASWAHDHVVWINGREQNQSQIVKLVEDYENRYIKIGGVNIDSAWSTGFNNFEWNLKKFPQPQKLINWLHQKGIKVILWVTSAVNKECSIYQEGLKNGYFLNHGKLIHWWHGQGALLDYFNPKAKQWWHQQMDKVLNMGVDGFKCDGTDPDVLLLRPWAYSPYLKRPISAREYSNAYYGDFYNYTKSRNDNGLIMARPTDSFEINDSFMIFRNFAPKYVMFSGWVGDEDSTFHGFKNAMINVIHSAWNGYLSFGFDIGGYRDKERSKFVFLRWAQTGAFLPFMENGGSGIHRPWQYGEQVANIYKKFVDIHYDLKPTFLTYGAMAYANKVSMIQPIAKRQSYAITLEYPKTFGYLLCQNLLIFPIFSENGVSELIFPDNSHWVYYFDHRKTFSGSLKTSLMFDLDESPIFLRNNSVIPFQSAIYIVGIQTGRRNYTFMHEDHTDRVEIDYDGQTFKTKINRGFKNQPSTTTVNTIKFKFIQFKMDVNNLSSNEVVQKKYVEDAIFVQFRVDGNWYTVQDLEVSSFIPLLKDQ